jgi:hypothetical protein
MARSASLALTHFVHRAVSDKASLVATDENPAYRYLDKGIKHLAVNHGKGEYVRGEIHTNKFLGVAEAGRGRHISPCQQGLSAAVSERIFIPPQQSAQRRCFRIDGRNVRSLAGRLSPR